MKSKLANGCHHCQRGITLRPVTIWRTIARWCSHVAPRPFSHRGRNIVLAKKPELLFSGCNAKDWNMYRMAHTLGLFFFLGFGISLHAGPLDSWQWRSPLPQGNTLHDVKYLNGEFIAVGDGGTILTSSNGVQWTLQNSGTTESLHSITFGNGQYAASGTHGTVLTSSDGLVWTTHNTGSTNSLGGHCVALRSSSQANTR